MINPIKAKLQEHDHRIPYIEDKMATMHNAHNQVVDFLQEQDKKLLWIKNKVADLEDRSHRNNIKFRGIPEAIQPQELNAYSMRLMQTIVPNLSETELLLDRIPKPAFLPDNTSLDV